MALAWITVGGVAPGSPQTGEAWYNTSNGTLLVFNNGSWVGAAPEYVQGTGIGATSTSFTLWVAPNTGDSWKISGVSVIFGTASSSGTMQIEVATGTQAVASGTNQLTGTMSLAGTAATTVNGTLITTPTTITAGGRINVILGGTLTSLANCCVTLQLVKTA
jgi:hypothetical protein